MGIDCSCILFIKQLRFVKENPRKKPRRHVYHAGSRPCQRQRCTSGLGFRQVRQPSARKKAQMAASAELAAILAKTVESTTEEYSTILSEGMSSESKSLLTDKTKITVNQTLAGATIVFDRWDKDEKTGQFINYIVLELKGDDYLKNLYKELEKNDAVTVDRDLLQRLFLKHIDKNSKK